MLQVVVVKNTNTFAGDYIAYHKNVMISFCAQYSIFIIIHFVKCIADYLRLIILLFLHSYYGICNRIAILHTDQDFSYR